MAPHALASEIYLHNPRLTKPPQRSYIIYFITGNPGLIEYYRIFLTHLYGLLTKDASSSTAFHVFGRSLSGFETSSEKDGSQPPFSLQEQISNSQSVLEDLVRDVQERDGVAKVRVVLMGHSVGSYMLLEIIRRTRETARYQTQSVRIVGGVCLFATVTHIAESDSGRKATPLLTLPYFPFMASILVKALTFFVPISVLTLLVRTVLSYPQDAARVSAAFVKSPYGIHQALHMARDEMREITLDRWDAEIWGSLSPALPEPRPQGGEHPHPRPALRFLFAHEDHWVASSTRDELIAARGRRPGEDWKPVMEIDGEEGWVHAFCIRQSVGVAERVGGWVREMVEGDGV